MNTLFSAAARTFVRVFAGALAVYGAGILAAPDLGAARALALAGLLGSIAAGLRAVQAYAPALTVTHWLGHGAGKYADAFLHGFLPALAAGLAGFVASPRLDDWRAVASGVVVGALTAGVRAVQATLQTGEGATPALGIAEPPAPPPPSAASSTRR